MLALEGDRWVVSAGGLPAMPEPHSRDDLRSRAATSDSGRRIKLPDGLSWLGWLERQPVIAHLAQTDIEPVQQILRNQVILAGGR